MLSWQNAAQLLELLKTSHPVTGRFDFRGEEGKLMDLDFENKTFQNCLFVGGDFASGIFRDCLFDKVIFLDLALVGVGFNHCHFKGCKFVNIQYSFGMDDCQIEHFIMTGEDARLTQRYLDPSKEIDHFLKP